MTIFADLDSQHVVQAQASIGEPLKGQRQEVVGHVVRQAAVPQPAAHEPQHVPHQRPVGRVVGGLAAQEHHGQQLDLRAGASALTWITLQVLGSVQASNAIFRLQIETSEFKFNFGVQNQMRKVSEFKFK